MKTLPIGTCGPKEKPKEILQGILEADTDLSFLQQLIGNDLETLVVSIRDRVLQMRK